MNVQAKNDDWISPRPPEGGHITRKAPGHDLRGADPVPESGRERSQVVVASDGEALGPDRVALKAPFSDGQVDPFAPSGVQGDEVRSPGELHQRVGIHQEGPPAQAVRTLCDLPGELTEAAVGPLARVADDAGSHHVHVDIGQAPRELRPALDGRCVVAVLPEGAAPVLPRIEFLGHPGLDELEGPGDRLMRMYLIPQRPVHRQQVDVVGGDHEVQDDQAVAHLRLERPMEPQELVLAELEKEFLLVTAMSDMPDVSGEEAPIRARHVEWPYTMDEWEAPFASTGDRGLGGRNSSF